MNDVVWKMIVRLGIMNDTLQSRVRDHKWVKHAIAVFQAIDIMSKIFNNSARSYSWEHTVVVLRDRWITEWTFHNILSVCNSKFPRVRSHRGVITRRSICPWYCDKCWSLLQSRYESAHLIWQTKHGKWRSLSIWKFDEIMNSMN